jgi:DNA-binding transcriptional MocR family regulator
LTVPEQYQIAGRSSRAIADNVERGISTGALHPDERLPAIRVLALRLGVSPATVATAYRLLRERGLVVAGGRRGTLVSARPPLGATTPVSVPAGVRDLRVGLPDQDLLPDLGPVLASLPARRVVARYGHEPDDDSLLALTRGRFDRDGVDGRHLAVVGGALDGIERALSTHIRRGDAVAVEDPSYPPVLDLLVAMGASPIPVAVDREGPRPEALRAALARRPAAVIVVPRAQNPTGAALTPSRAAELRALLRSERELLVVEDDYAHDIADTSFQTLTNQVDGRWAIVRSVSKSLHPDLRLAVVAGDATTIARLRGRQALGTGWVSTILQQTVAALWTDPGTERFVERARAAYAERCAALMTALAERGVTAAGGRGLNVWVPVREEAAAVEALLAAGWAVRAGEPFRLRTPPGIRVTIATLQPHEAPALAHAIAATQRSPTTARAY